MALTNSLTGKGGSLTINSTAIPITGWSPSLSIDTADSTDSNNFDVATGTLWKSQAPGAQGVEVSIEGNFDLSTTSSAVITAMKSGNSQVNLTLSYDRTNNYCTSSPFLLVSCDVKLSVPGATMVTWSGKAVSQGKPTLN